MNVEVTFFLSKGNEIRFVESQYTTYHDLMSHYHSALTSKEVIHVNKDTIVALEHVTHFTATIIEETDGAEEVETSEGVKTINGVSYENFVFMSSEDANNFIIPAMKLYDIRGLAKAWGVEELQVRNTLTNFGFLK